MNVIAADPHTEVDVALIDTDAVIGAFTVAVTNVLLAVVHPLAVAST